MKNLKFLQTLILALTLALTFCAASAFAQTSPNSIPTPQSKVVVNRDQAIAILTKEVRAARELVAKNNETIAALEAQIKSEQDNSASLSRSYERAKSEIERLRSANNALERAIASQEKTIALLQGELDKEQAGKKKWKARAVQAYILFGISILTKVL